MREEAARPTASGQPAESLGRVLHAPADAGGQATLLVSRLRALGVDAVSLDRPASTSPIRLSAFRHSLLHVHSRATVWPRRRDLMLWRALRRAVLMHFHADDARLTERAARENPWYRRPEGADSDTAIMDRLRRLGRWMRVAVVADGETEGYVRPYFRRVERVPLAIDLDAVGPPIPPVRSLPVVVHAPSDARAAGTDDVLAAVRRLPPSSPLEFRLREGLPDHRRLEELRGADIVIEGVREGSYGIAAVQAMALGKPVIAYLRPGPAGGDPTELPIVSADPRTLTDVLAALLADAPRRLELGARGRTYAEHVHALPAVADRLLRLYLELGGGADRGR